MKRLVIATALCLTGPAVAAPTVVAAPVVASIDDEAVPADEMRDYLEQLYWDLDWIESDLESGFFGEPEPDDFDRIDDLWLRADDLETRAGEATYGELFALMDDVTEFIIEISDRGAGFPVPPPGPSGSEDPPFGTPTDSGADDFVDPETDALARQTAGFVFIEAQTLLALGAFPDDGADLIALIELLAVDFAGDADRDALIAQLTEVDDHAEGALAPLSELSPPISAAVKQTVARLLDSDRELVASGGQIPIPSDLYVSAIEMLTFRSGRPDVNEDDHSLQDLAASLRGELMTLRLPSDEPPEPPEPADGEIVDAEPTDTTDTTDTSAAEPAAEPAAEELTTDSAAGQDATDTPATTPAPGDDSGSPIVLILIVVGAIALAGLAVWFFTRRRQAGDAAGPGRPAFQDLLDVSRRLAAAESIVEVEQMAVQQAIRLCHAFAGAFVRHADRQLVLGYSSDDGLLVEDRLGEGVLDRVVGTGQELIQISQTEPSIRNLPVSLIAVPVFARGAIVGAIVLLQSADEPFDDQDLAMLVNLKPIVGASIETVQTAERAKAEAFIDGLTGAKNRRALDQAITERGDEIPFAAIMVDLDHFKSVNDTYGHQAGDDLLRAVVGRISDSVRPGDEVYRYGGEEFAIVLPDTDEDTACEVAERVRAAVAQRPFVIGTDAVRHEATASLGVAAGPGGAAVIGRADAALYEAKQNGRDRVERAAVPA